jgi:hypothetical protein
VLLTGIPVYWVFSWRRARYTRDEWEAKA